MVLEEFRREITEKFKGRTRTIREKMIRLECEKCQSIHERTLKHYNNMKKKYGDLFNDDYCNSCWRPILSNRPEYKKSLSDGVKQALYERGDEIKNKISKACKGTKMGDENPMRRAEVRAKVSATRTAMMKDPEERQKYVQGSIDAHARGVYIGIDTSGRCKWHTYQHSNGNKYKVQGTWELKFIEWLDNNNVEFECHKGRLPYVDGEFTRNYYPDFFVPSMGGYIDVKSTYWYKKQQDKWKKLIEQYPGQITVLTEYELRKLGIKL